MDKQAAAERDRREHVLRAEGAKRRAELESEGVRISLQNESEVRALLSHDRPACTTVVAFVAPCSYPTRTHTHTYDAFENQ